MQTLRVNKALGNTVDMKIHPSLARTSNDGNFFSAVRKNGEMVLEVYLCLLHRGRCLNWMKKIHTPKTGGGLLFISF